MFAEGYPKTLTRRYRNDNLLSLSERQRGGTVAGYGIAECRVHSAEEEAAAKQEGFSDGPGAIRYPVTLELSAIPGGAPTQRFTVISDQEYANICCEAWESGRKVVAIT